MNLERGLKLDTGFRGVEKIWVKLMTWEPDLEM